ncbi:hypothetical protein J6590_078542 [Homalodisca vitripennis]|nr:hypothetical protein J6590_078542 [Homalodisca vitripennis]
MFSINGKILLNRIPSTQRRSRGAIFSTIQDTGELNTLPTFRLTLFGKHNFAETGSVSYYLCRCPLTEGHDRSGLTDQPLRTDQMTIVWTSFAKNCPATFLIRRLKQVCAREATRTAYFDFLECVVRYGIAS